MGLFARYHISREDAERTLSRSLAGGPGQGEVAILRALNADRFRDVRTLIDDAVSISPDFRDLVESRLAMAASRNGHAIHKVRLPVATLRHYETIAARTNQSVSECLEAAIERDRSAEQHGTNATEELSETVRQYHTAVGHLSEQLQEGLRQLGAVGGLESRLARIDGLLTSILRRR